MTDFIDRYEQQLLTAARARAARRAWLHPRRPTRLVAVAAAFVAVGGTAVAATRPWEPLLGTATNRGATLSPEAPPSGVLGLLGVLRRPQTDADRGEETAYVLTFVGKNAEGVRAGSIRLLHTDSSGAGYVLVPLTRRHESVGEATLPMSAARRARTARNLCVYSVDEVGGQRDGVGVSCFSPDDIKTGQAIASLGPRYFGMVPDGVAAIEATFRNGERIRADVVDNFFILTGPSNDGGQSSIFPDRTTWLDGDGSAVKTIDRLPGAPPAG